MTTGGQESGAQPELCIGGCARNGRSCSTWPQPATPQKTGARCIASCCADHSLATASESRNQPCCHISRLFTVNSLASCCHHAASAAKSMGVCSEGRAV